MNSDFINHALKALDPPSPQQPRNRASFAPVEGLSPTDDARTAGVVDPNYDGAPYCSHCGARQRRYCKCGPTDAE